MIKSMLSAAGGLGAAYFCTCALLRLCGVC